MNQLSGYIEIEAAGEVLPFKFGTNAWALFCQEKNIELYEIASTGIFGSFEDGKLVKNPDFVALRDIFHAGYVTAMRMRGKEPVFNSIMLGELLDEVPNAYMKLQDTLMKSKMLGFTFGEPVEEDGKANFQKKSPGGG